MIIVLTSRENFVWTSMQEIIPSLEECWSALPNVHLIDVDKTSLKEVLPKILKATHIVQTCFTTKIALWAHKIRTHLNLDAQFIIHLHSMATIGCWPMHAWKMGEVLRQSDIFIGTCERDRVCMDLCFKNHQTEIIPFCLKDLNQNETKLGEKRLVYIGRLSAQKNLHVLFVALKLLKDQGFVIPLELYGGADHLGSPNMELYNDNYPDYLNSLSNELGLKGQISFHGFVPREKLYKELGKDHIFISPSLHSDENFGIAALRSLAMGAKAILTDWGGHRDHQEHFPKQVELVKVYSSKHGPYLNPFELAEGIKNSLKGEAIELTPLPERFKAKNISKSFEKLLIETSKESIKLEQAPEAKKILEQRAYFVELNKDKKYQREEHRKGCQIFKSYDDPLAHAFFKAYGAIPEKRKSGKVYRLPWNEDIHRGSIEVQTEDELLDVGYAFIIPDDFS